MNYVAGLLISEDLEKFLLVKKKRPDWQAGLFNFIGGKIEEGETSHQAIVREFKEETGLDSDDWKHFLTLKDDRQYEVYFYVGSGSLDGFESKTDEEIHEFEWNDISFLQKHDLLIPNLRWIIEMALNKFGGIDESTYTVVERV